MYRLTSDQEAVVRRARELAEERLRPQAEAVDAEAAYPRASMEALAQAGFWGLTLPAEYGGMGQNLRVMCAVLDELAQRCASTAMCYLMHLCGVAAYQAGERKPEALLREAAAGKHLATLAWSEFGSRSHFWVAMSQERLEGDTVLLDATKSFVTSAGVADGYVVSTRWAAAASPLQSTLYLVRRTDPGVRVAGEWHGLGMRGNMSAPVKFEGVRLGPDRALSAPGKGMDTMLGVVLPVFNLGNAAISTGIAEAAVQTTQKHITGGRYQYSNQSLAEIPLERARLAEMRIETDKARAHLAASLDAVESPGPATMLFVLASKAAAAESSLRVTDVALRACGGTGFTRSLGLERGFRDARAAAVMGPTSDLIHDFIGKALCGMELFA